MEWLFILGLIAGFLALAGRLRQAERRIASIEEDFAARLHGIAAEAPPPPVAAPVRPARAARPLRQEPEPKAIVSPYVEPEVAVSEPVATTPDAGRSWFAVPRFDLEDVFGRRLPIWAGGLTLAVAGVFLVRYSIERGLITPLLRVIMAFLFGVALLGGAEAAFRFRERVADPRVAQALAGAGLATLYAAFYLAGTQYGLIGQALAFLGLASVTAGAIALSFRFGLPSAVLGLVGGFAAPALVGGEDANLPLLSLYLGLVTAGLVLSGRRQQRTWLGVSALVAGLGWGAILLASGSFGIGEAVALGLYLVVIGAVLPSLVDAPQFERPVRIAAALAASVQLAMLVDHAGYAPLIWSLYLLLGAALAWFGWRRPDMREGSAMAALVAVVLLSQWSGAAPMLFAAVAAGIAVVFAGVPLAVLARRMERRIDGLQIAGVALGLSAVAYSTFGAPWTDRLEWSLAVATFALAALPGAAAWLLRARDDVPVFAIQLGACAALVFAALLMLTPGWSAPLAAAAVFAVLIILTKGRGEYPIPALLRGAAIVALFALVGHSRSEVEIARLFGAGVGDDTVLATLRWLALAAVFATLAWRERSIGERRFAEAGAVAFAYGMLAQFLPRDLLAAAAAVIAIALQIKAPYRAAGRATALLIAAAWAAAPLTLWLEAGLRSLSGGPVYVTALPDMHDLVTRMLPVLAALSIARVPLPANAHPRLSDRTPAMAVGVIVTYILFKQLFAIDTVERFIQLGLAERTAWEALLLGAAWFAARGLGKIAPNSAAAAALATAGLAHFALYSGLLHNPLWTAQELGQWPIVNLALPAYGVAIAAALSLRRWLDKRALAMLDGAAMVLACLAALTLLRQLFAGSLPANIPLSQTEDLLRSLTGILLALGFLWLGSRRGERSWRVGSLVIMLVAVAKVFLVDAAGLDGLLRVASFMALGFSLIGIGWVYSRQLRSQPATSEEAAG